MKATALIFAMVLTGLILELSGYPTLGSSILIKVLPSSLYSGGSASWSTGFIVVGGSVLAFGAVLLGSKVPYTALLLFMLALISIPISIVTDPTIGMPSTLRIIIGGWYLSLFVGSIVSIYRSDA